jgi:hypothetical protein
MNKFLETRTNSGKVCNTSHSGSRQRSGELLFEAKQSQQDPTSTNKLGVVGVVMLIDGPCYTTGVGTLIVKEATVGDWALCVGKRIYQDKQVGEARRLPGHREVGGS